MLMTKWLRKVLMATKRIFSRMVGAGFGFNITKIKYMVTVLSAIQAKNNSILIKDSFGTLIAFQISFHISIGHFPRHYINFFPVV